MSAIRMDKATARAGVISIDPIPIIQTQTKYQFKAYFIKINQIARRLRFGIAMGVTTASPNDVKNHIQTATLFSFCFLFLFLRKCVENI